MTERFQMRRRTPERARAISLLGAIGLVLGAATATAEDGATKVDLYGFAMLDTGYQSGQNDPDWFDVLRPTKLPAFEDEFGDDGQWFASVRQTRFGVKTKDRKSVV